MNVIAVFILLVQISLICGKEFGCGYHTFDKIYDGEYVAIDEFPWLARLEFFFANGTSGGYFCAGALISEYFVLTAAHCVVNNQAQGLFLHKVRLGEYDADQPKDCVTIFGFKDCSDDPVDAEIEYTLMHPGHTGMYNDIALIKLKNKVTFSDFIRPICLPFNNDFQRGEKLTVSGWGQTETKKKSNIKLKVEVPIVGFKDCFDRFLMKGTRLSQMQHICAGGAKGQDSCTGDSGGPLMSNSGDGRWKIVGIVSSGNTKCGIQGWPAIYTRVSSYLHWISENMRL